MNIHRETIMLEKLLEIIGGEVGEEENPKGIEVSHCLLNLIGKSMEKRKLEEA